MVSQAVRYAFEILNMSRVTLKVFDNNLSAYKCYQNEESSIKVLKRNELLKENTPLIWEYVKEVIEDSIQKGGLKR